MQADQPSSSHLVASGEMEGFDLKVPTISTLLKLAAAGVGNEGWWGGQRGMEHTGSAVVLH